MLALKSGFWKNVGKLAVIEYKPSICSKIIIWILYGHLQCDFCGCIIKIATTFLDGYVK